MSWNQQKYPRPLAKRLQPIYDVLTPGLPVWDFGCDHGHLGEAAWRSGQFTDIHLVDFEAHIIDTLKNRLKIHFAGHYDLDRLHFHVADVTKESFLAQGNLVFAGIGGQNLIQMLACQCPTVRPDVRLILAPHKDVEMVRLYLNEHSWKLVYDAMIEDRRRFYELIVVEAEGETIQLLGNHLDQQPDIYGEYLQKRLKHFRAHERREPEVKSYIRLLEQKLETLSGCKLG